MKRLKIGFIIGFVILILFPLKIKAEVIFTEGVGAIIGGNIAVARDKAIDDALRKAVEQAVGTIVSSDTMSENYKVIYDKILTQSSGYIRKYKILSEKREGNIYKVMIEAEVGKENLLNDLKALGLLHVLKEKPKLMILIDEKVGEFYGTVVWEKIGQAESTIIEKFINAGFNVVDSKTVRTNITRDKALRMLEGDFHAAKAEGLKYGAQIVIVGKAFSKSAGGNLYGTRLQSIHATVQATVIRTDTGKVLSSRSATGTKVHVDELQGGALAIKEASEKLAVQLINDIINQWRSEVYGRSQEITLMISGLSSYRDLLIIKRFLEKETQGVKNVYQRSYISGVAELMIDYGGKTSNLADELSNKNFQSFRLEPTNVTPNRVDVKVIKQ